jgi:hypothetical protein
MAWAKPEYSRTSVDSAGKTYIDRKTTAEDREMALAVINNWRSSHSYPLNAMQMNLRNLAGKYDRDPTVAQRIKRLRSIRHKLERFGWIKLSVMQDIGGCRAVLSSVKKVDALVDYYLSTSRAKHHLVRHDPYIVEPKKTGYRGVHLIYSYNGREDWTGLKVEIQIRSRLQHAWATAVEIVGTFTRQALKSSQGQENWLRFFELMSSAHALREGTPLAPNTPDDPETLKRELRSYAKKLKAIELLEAYGSTLEHVEKTMPGVKGGHFFLLELDVDEQELSIWDFESAIQANEEYEALERAIEGNPGKDALLVTVESIAALQRAYPNYFLDTTAFVESVREAVA